MNYPYFFLVNMINWWGLTLTEKRGVLGTGQVKKGGLRHGSGKKGGSLLRHIPVLDIYVSAPPPPPRMGLPILVE